MPTTRKKRTPSSSSPSAKRNTTTIIDNDNDQEGEEEKSPQSPPATTTTASSSSSLRRSSRHRRPSVRSNKERENVDNQKKNANATAAAAAATAATDSTRKRKATAAAAAATTKINNKKKITTPTSNNKTTTTTTTTTTNNDDGETETEQLETIKKQRRKNKLRQTIDILHREMDVATYSKTESGQYRRIVPKSQSKLKTSKRRSLEREDDDLAEWQRGTHDTTTITAKTNLNKKTKIGTGGTSPSSSSKNNKRLRGSMWSLADTVLDASLPLAAATTRTAELIEASTTARDKKDDDGGEMTDAEQLQQTDGEGGEISMYDMTDGDDVGNFTEDGGNFTAEEGGNMTDGLVTGGNLTERQDDEEDEQGQLQQGEQTTTASSSSKLGKKRGPYKKRPDSQKKKLPGPTTSRRRLYRLRNFRSYKMAQRHGYALGAHAKGQHTQAIEQLRSVAKDAPSAPQVYSSLGLVYHDMYQNLWKKKVGVANTTTTTTNTLLQQSTSATKAASAATAAAATANGDGNDQQQQQDADETKTTTTTDEATKNTTTSPSSKEDPPADPSSDSNNKEQEQQQEDKVKEKEDSDDSDSDSDDSDDSSDDDDDYNITPQEQVLIETINLAKKSYGSYHIAAILCKKDYTLWVRASDTACDIAALYGLLRGQQQQQINNYITSNNNSNNNSNSNNNILNRRKRDSRQSRRQQEHWYGEAKNDLQTADNLKPIGFEVAIKLISLHMELGQFSEALTLWTDLLHKQQQQQQQGASSSSSSSQIFTFTYSAWLLYSECMLQIGYECRQWMNGNQSNRNYMFRRWLRKFATSFNYEERRLQALVLALETAAGSTSCSRLLWWMQQRQNQQQQQQQHDDPNQKSSTQQQLEQDEIEKAKETAAVEFAESLVMDEDVDDVEVEEEQDDKQQPTKEKEADMSSSVAGAALKGGKMFTNDDDEKKDDSTSAAAAETEKTTDNGLDDKEDATEPTEEEEDNTTNELMTGSNPKEQQQQRDSASADGTSGTNDDPGDSNEGRREEDDPTEHADDEEEDDDDDDDAPPPPVNDEFEKEKRLLLQQNIAELKAFDQTTKNMLGVLGKDDSKEGRANKNKAYHERRNARRKMERYHKAQINKLAMEYQERTTDGKSKNEDGTDNHQQQQQKQQQEQHLEGNPESSSNRGSAMPSSSPSPSSSDGDQKPITASCRVVCSIACQLMKHLLRMKLYEGGRLVGEAVSLYMKERARIHDKKMETRRKLEQQADPLERLFGNPGPGFDEDDDADSSDDEDAQAAYLSDDEMLEADDDDGGYELLESLRRGVLPPEVSVLYATSLIHVGGRNFIAKKCIESIDDLEQESRSWLTETVSNTSLATSEEWQFCQAKATDPFGRTAAYAFLAETLYQTPREAEWSEYLAPLFRAHMDGLQQTGLAAALVDPNIGQSASSKYRIQQVLKAVNAWARLQVASDKSAYIEARRFAGSEEGRAAKLSIIHSFKLMKKLLHISSSESLLIEGDGSISEGCKEILKIFAEGYAILMKEDDCPLDKEVLEELVSECGELVAWFCQSNPSEGDTGITNSTIFDSTEWDKVPLPSCWQSKMHKAISLRCYNLCVAYNVSHFSGWEPTEFSLRLMTTRASCTYFGLQIKEGKVAGFLSAFAEDELSQQWECLGDFLPAASAFKFNIRLAETKNLYWYKSGHEKHKEAMEDEPIASNVEHEALQVLLSHSKACLELARQKDASDRDDLLMTSLSILLPISQFCLDKNLWNSKVGKAAAYDDTNLEGWRQVTRKRVIKERTASSTSKRRRTPKEPARPLDAWFPGEDRNNPLSNAVTIPISDLQKLWGQQTDYSRKVPTTYARRAMRKVHDAMEKLRACYTDAAVEKASLQVACALLDLASVNFTCENPFLVLQQAAIFASHGTKRGTSDDLFRESLPDLEKCSPHEALVILGRADCFHSVYFPYEAAYLCAYVARVCSLHRFTTSEGDYDSDDGNKFEAEDGDNETKEQDASSSTWSNQWMVIGVLCYNVSIMIRSTAVGKLGGVKIKEDYDPWDKDVIDELLLARADAVAWKSSLNRGRQFTFKDCSRKAPSEDSVPLKQSEKVIAVEQTKELGAGGEPVVVDDTAAAMAVEVAKEGLPVEVGGEDEPPALEGGSEPPPLKSLEAVDDVGTTLAMSEVQPTRLYGIKDFFIN